jgi:hypothetical protein
MRTLRYFIAASVLLSTLTLSTFAGDMHTGIAPPPNPAPATTEGEITTGIDGDIHTTNSEAAIARDSVAGAALGVVQSVLSLF